MRISDWSSDVCSSDLAVAVLEQVPDRVANLDLRGCGLARRKLRRRPPLAAFLIIDIVVVATPSILPSINIRFPGRLAVKKQRGEYQQKRQQDRKSTRLNSRH